MTAVGSSDLGTGAMSMQELVSNRACYGSLKCAAPPHSCHQRLPGDLLDTATFRCTLPNNTMLISPVTVIADKIHRHLHFCISFWKKLYINVGSIH
jgi:hypothetical protein